MRKGITAIFLGISIILGLIIIIFYSLQMPDKEMEYLTERYTDEESKFIDIQGMKVHYKIEGQGPTIILLHGTASSLHTWDVWTRVLKDSFKVIRLDLPAYGLTGPNPERKYGFEFYRNFLQEFMNKLGVESCILGGNSFGGNLAWQMAVHFPERIDKLILVDASGYPTEELPAIFKLARNPILSKVIKNLTPRSLIEKNVLEVYHNDSKVTQALIDRYFELTLREGNRDAFIDRANTEFIDESNRISEIQCPTLILWGQHDSWTPLQWAYQFEEAIKNSRLIVYPDAGHVPMEEIPLKTVYDLQSFLAETF